MNALIGCDRFKEPAAPRHGSGDLYRPSPIHWPEGQEEQMTLREYAPLVDISEDDEGYVIKAELPGVKQEDAMVTIDNATLIITGDRKFDQNRKRDRPVENANGRFAHVFLLPTDAWPAEVSAEFRNEVLIMHLAKNDESGPQQVVVEADAYERIRVREFHSSGWGIDE